VRSLIGVDDLSVVRSYTNEPAWQSLPLPLRVVTHYANTRSSERSWRRNVLGPFRRMILGNAPIPQHLPVFGIGSFSEFEAALSEFRGVLDELCAASPKDNVRLRGLLETIHDRSQLQITRQLYDRRSRRLKPAWETKNSSFIEMLYSNLILSFYQFPIDSLRRCAACGRFFFTPSGQRAKYCTGRCQIRTAMQKYRARKKRRADRKPTEH
jgi:hypothetical protein